MSILPRRFDPTEFNARILEWAKQALMNEVHSGFSRCQTFDADRTVEQLAVLRKQPLEQLLTLAEVLPLGLISETPDAVERRKRLTPEQAQAVELLKMDYDTEWHKNWAKTVERIANANRGEIQQTFRAAAKKGRTTLDQIASLWDCQATVARLGEWGLILRRKWGQFTVCLNLGQAMTLGYSISVLDNELRSIRFHDHYLGVLGIGSGEWNVADAEDLPEKLKRASEFARWHVEQYEAIINTLLKK